jgi:major membrane immunogen (membrane-anchored lipoprotein)
MTALLTLAILFPLMAADISGKWTASFETQIGVQNYTYEFKVDGTKLTGSVKSNLGAGTITDGEVKGDEVSFVEHLKVEDQEIRITYKGKISGDEIKFTREVGEFATEQLVARRAK